MPGKIWKAPQRKCAKLSLEGWVATGGREEVLEVGRMVGGRETEEQTG